MQSFPRTTAADYLVASSFGLQQKLVCHLLRRLTPVHCISLLSLTVAFCLRGRQSTFQSARRCRHLNCEPLLRFVFSSSLLASLASCPSRQCSDRRTLSPLSIRYFILVSLGLLENFALDSLSWTGCFSFFCQKTKLARLTLDVCQHVLLQFVTSSFEPVQQNSAECYCLVRSCRYLAACILAEQQLQFIKSN